MEIIRTESVELPNPNQFGFCEGVEAAHQLMERTTTQAHRLGIMVVYGFNEIVHNDTVSNFHRNNGVVFVHDSSEIPNGSLVVPSAHGHSPEVTHDIVSRGGYVVDGMCSLVGHTHNAVSKARKNREKILYIYDGKLGHDEVVGTVGHMDYYIDKKGNLRDDQPVDRAMLQLPGGDFENIVKSQFSDILRLEDPRYRVVGQTTLIASKVHSYIESLGRVLETSQRKASIARLNSIRQVCFAVEDRQKGVENAVSVSIGRKMPPEVTVVVTSPNSTNGNSYATQAKEIGPDDMIVITVARAEELTAFISELEVRRVFVTASASTPDIDIRGVVARLGGDISLVPEIRGSFRIPNSKDEDLYRRISNWKKAKHGR